MNWKVWGEIKDNRLICRAESWKDFDKECALAFTDKMIRFLKENRKIIENQKEIK